MLVGMPAPKSPSRRPNTVQRPRGNGKSDMPFPLGENFGFMDRDEPDVEETKPGVVLYARMSLVWVGTSIMFWGAFSLAGHKHSVFLFAAAALLSWSVVFGVLWSRWHRRDESKRLYCSMRPLADLPRTPSKRAWRVNRWSGLEPCDVTLRPGAKFLWDDPSVSKIVDRFTSLLNADPGKVRSERGKRGSIRVYVSKEPFETITPTGGVATEPQASGATSRVRDALAAVLDDAVAVQITQTHADGSPSAGILFYPSKATQKARGIRGDLPTVMADTCPPKAENGRWRFTWEPDRDRFMFADEPDPLVPLVPLPPIDPEPDLVRGVKVGVTESGEDWFVPILHNHIVIVGESKSGKGSILWGIIRGLMPLILDGRCLLYVSDPKGGMELGDLEPLCHRFALADGTAKMLEEAVRDMEAQARRIAKIPGTRLLEKPTLENPLRVVIVDEITSALAYDKASEGHLSFLLAQGRAPGTVVIGALQDPRVNKMDARSMFLYRIVLRLGDAKWVDLVLGNGRRKAGAMADMIPKTLKGAAYIESDTMDDPVRVRAAFTDDAEIARLTVQIEKAPDHTPVKSTEPVPIGEVIEALPVKRPPTTIKVRDLKFDAYVTLPGQDEPVTVVSSEESNDGYYLVTYVPSWSDLEESELFEAHEVATPV